MDAVAALAAGGEIGAGTHDRVEIEIGAVKLCTQHLVPRAQHFELAVARAQVALRDSFLPTEKDFRPILNKVRGAEPDALILEAYYNESSLLLTQARDQSLKLPVFANGAVYSPQFLKLGGDAVYIDLD